MGRHKVEEVRQQRSIRLTDEEWEIFKRFKLLEHIKKLIAKIKGTD